MGTTVPQDENLPTCAPSGLEPPTYHILGRQRCSVHHGLNNSATKTGNTVSVCPLILISSFLCLVQVDNNSSMGKCNIKVSNYKKRKIKRRAHSKIMLLSLFPHPLILYVHKNLPEQV